MILPGHVAAAALAALALRTDLRGALASAMFPDMVDKPVRWLLRLTPNDRLPAHTLLVWAGTTVIAHHSYGRQFAGGWATGYAAHLLCDEANSHLNPGRIYFWWPFRRYRLHSGPKGLRSSLSDFSRASLALEVLVTIAGIAAWASRRRRSTLTFNEEAPCTL